MSNLLSATPEDLRDNQQSNFDDERSHSNNNFQNQIPTAPSVPFLTVTSPEEDTNEVDNRVINPPEDNEDNGSNVVTSNRLSVTKDGYQFSGQTTAEGIIDISDVENGILKESFALSESSDPNENNPNTILGDFDFEAEYKMSLEDHVPFHLSRWVVLTIFCIFLFFNGQVVNNWPPFRSLLLKDNAYGWLCSPDDIFDADNTCGAQRDQLAQLGSTCMSMVFIGSAVAGAILDFMGPRLLTCSASVLTAFGYLLLAFSGESFKAYYPGFICVAMGIEPAMTGLFDFPFLFPGSTSLILSLFAVGRSFGYAYPIIMDAMWSPSFPAKYIFLLTMGIALAWSVAMVLLVPRYPYLSPEQFRALVEMDDLDEFWQARAQAKLAQVEDLAGRDFADGSEGGACSISPSAVKFTYDTKLNSKRSNISNLLAVPEDENINQPAESYAKLTASFVSKLESKDSISKANSKVIEEFTWGQANREPLSDGHPRTARSERSVISMDRKSVIGNVWSQFFKTVLSAKYWPWVFAFASNVLRNTYYGNSAADQLGEASNFFVIMSPLSFIPCLPFGILADKFSCFLVMFIINGCGLVATLLLAISQSVPFNYISVVFFWFLQSFATSQNYVFTAQMFPPFLMGRLTGLSMLVAGLIGFLASPLYSFGSKKGFTYSDWVATGLSLLTLSIAVLLFLLHKDTVKENRKMQKDQNMEPQIEEIQKIVHVESPLDGSPSPINRVDSKTGLDEYVRANKAAYHQVAAGEQGQAALAMIWAPSVRENSKVQILT